MSRSSNLSLVERALRPHYKNCEAGDGLRGLDKRFAALRSDWETMSRHVGNAHANVARVDGSLVELEQAWRRTVESQDDEA